MRFLLALILVFPVLAQQPEPQAKPAEKAPAVAPSDQKPADQKPADQQPAAPAAAAAAAAPSPAPATDQWFTGDIEFGYRWVTGPAGSVPEYRTVVNLNQGPQLFGADFMLQDPKKRLFDRLTVSGYGWGGQPYNSAMLNASKQSVYRLSFDYRNMAYFAAEPSFANPFAPGGFNEQSFDTRRRVMSFDLDLFPGKRIIPYLAADRNTWQGQGIDTFVLGSLNSFPVPTTVRDATNDYRGGVRFEFNRWHVTLEQGGTTFKDDDATNYTDQNTGNRTTPFLGQTLILNSLQQAYGIRGTSIYSKILATARVNSRMDVYGQFLYSEPRTDVSYTEVAGGNFALAQSLLFYGGQLGLATGTAVLPHVTANVGFELRPWKRTRVVESLIVDRSHDAGFGMFAAFYLQSLANPTQVGSATTTLNPLQAVNYTQNQVDVFYDVTPKLTLRGGYRFLTGNASVVAGQLSQTGTSVSGNLRRNVGIAGVTYRLLQKLTLHGEYEGSSSDDIYFRTSLNDYSKVRAIGKYQINPSLIIQGSFNLLDNHNPAPDIRYDFESRDSALSIFWTPNSSKWVTVMAEYDRATLSSDINYLDLPFLTSAVSTYRERTHTAISTVDVNLPGTKGGKLTAGGSLFISSGSRPTNYYQPLARLSLPLQKHVYWNTEWQWYGYSEQIYSFEGFRTHVLMTGLRLTR
jgi:hypothetical protein